MSAVSEALTEFAPLTPVEKMAFLCLLSLNLTVAARDVFHPPDNSPIQTFKARAYNEILHKVLGCLPSMIKGNTERYPDEVLLNIIFAMAGEAGIGDEFRWEWTRSMKSVHAKRYR
jgi:hypothetical protein